MKTNTLQTALFLIFWSPLVASIASPTKGFRSLGPVIYVNTSTDALDPLYASQFGYNTYLSSDGKRLAVGSPNDSGGAVFLYERNSTAAVAAEFSWNLIWELHGDTLGRGLSLSQDGNTLAIRRHGDVEIYRYSSSNKTMKQEGPSISTCGDSKGTSVKLGATTSVSIFGEADWLLVSCESFDKNRGKVEVFRYAELLELWLPITAIQGSEPGSFFGWNAGFFTENNNFLQIMVSSPNYNSKRGLVQAFNIDPTGAFAQLGRNLLGQKQGDQFGFSIDVTPTGNQPYAVVGAPQCDGDGIFRGCVQVFSWNRLSPNDAMDWNTIGDTQVGSVNGMRLGRSVAITKNGGRVAASSFHFNIHSGIVQLWERNSSRSLVHIGDFVGQTPLGRFGNSIALNGPGSMLVSGTVNDKDSRGQTIGSVQVFLDENCFCSLPLDQKTTELFLHRPLCRNGDRVVSSAEECTSQYSWKYDNSCRWVNGRSVASNPTSSPTTTWTFFFSFHPSGIPSKAPKQTTFNVTAHPTLKESKDEPLMSASPSINPSTVSTTESTSPNASPSINPSTTSTTESFSPSTIISTVESNSNPSNVPSTAEPTFSASGDGLKHTGSVVAIGVSIALMTVTISVGLFWILRKCLKRKADDSDGTRFAMQCK